MSDDLPELRLLDQPMKVPQEFETRLRAELVATFESEGSSRGGPNVVPLQRLSERRDDAVRQSRRVWLAAACLIAVAVGAVSLIATNRESPPIDITVTDQVTACAQFSQTASGGHAVAAAALAGDAEAIGRVRAAVELYLADAARLGLVDGDEITQLQNAAGALTEAELDLADGDDVGAVQAVSFAIERLTAVRAFASSSIAGGVICR